MISWKHSYNRLNEEYEIAIKKKHALDNLYENGKISQSTHISFNTEIAAAIAEIEKQQQALINKMQAKTDELQNQIQTLEVLLANYEIQHVTGEIDEDTYKLEITLITNGLETARRELGTIQNATIQLSKPVAEAVAAESAPEPVAEVAPTPAPIADPIEIPIAAPPVDVAPSYVVSAPEPIISLVAEAEAVPVIEEQNIEVASAPAPEPTAEIPVAEATPVVEAAPVVEATPEVAAAAPESTPEPAQVIEAPVEAPKVEESVVAETPVVEPAPTVEQPAIVEDTPVVEEQPTVEIAPAVETPAEVPPAEPAPVIEQEDATIENAPLDDFQVSKSDVVQKELLQVVEEIAENPLVKAPSEAQEKAAAETPAEVSAETQPVSNQAKDTMHVDAASSEGEE